MISGIYQAWIATGSAMLGAYLTISLGISPRRLCALVSFAAGTLCAMAFFYIIPEGLESFLWLAAFAILASGYLFFYFISNHISHACPACAGAHIHKGAEALRKIFILLAAALAIHNSIDGLAIAVADKLGEKISIPISVSLIVHKLPEGLALCALLLRADYSRIAAFITTLVFEFFTLLGFLAGNFFLQGPINNFWPNLILLHIGGGFLYLAIYALQNESKTYSLKFVFPFFIFGMILIGLMGFL